jgi:hypothetical protein
MWYQLDVVSTGTVLQIAVCLLLTKPWGLMGEQLAAVPTLRLKAQGALKIFAGKEVFPEIRVPGVVTESLGLNSPESNVSGAIPWYSRFFLH